MSANVFRVRDARATAFDVVRRNESTMRVMLSSSNHNNNNNNNGDNSNNEVPINHAQRIMQERARMEASLEHVLETLQSAQHVHKLVFEWTRQAFLTLERRDRLVKRVATIQGLRELVFVASANVDAAHDERNSVPVTALNLVLQSLPQLTRLKIGQGVCLQGTQEEMEQFATTISNHTSLKHCELHGSLGNENEHRRTLILEGVAKSKTLETVWVGEYSETTERSRPATSETARLLRMPRLVSLEISRAHIHFVVKAMPKAKHLKTLILRHPMEGTGIELFGPSLKDNQTLQTLVIQIAGTDYTEKSQAFVEAIVDQAKHLNKFRIVVRSEGRPPLNETHLTRLSERLVRNGHIQVECLQLHSKKGDSLKLDPVIRAADNNLRVQSAINKAGRYNLQNPARWMKAMESLSKESGPLHRTRCYFCFFKMNPDMLAKMARVENADARPKYA